MNNNKIPKNICVCCGKIEVELFDICEVCDWQNDPLQNDMPDYTGGANIMSLNQAKEEYFKLNK